MNPRTELGNAIGRDGDDRTWTAQAACRDYHPELWFPMERMGSAGRMPYTNYTEARKICEGCPSRAACLDFALRYDEQYGLWGGLTPHERQALRRGGAA